MRKDGFTLFELLITLTILAVVFSVLYMTFHQSMMVMAGMEDRTEVIQRGRMILERMAGELKGGFLPSQENRSRAFCYGLVGKSAREGDQYKDRLDFATSVPAQSNPSGRGEDISEIGYYLDHEPDGKGLTLFRRQDDAGDGDLLKGGRSLSVCDQVRGLHFIFFDRKGEKQEEWDSLAGAHRNELPSRIEIHLKLEDANGQVHIFRTQVYLPLSGGRG